MSTRSQGQAGDSVARNQDFFAGDTYARNADRLDSHASIRSVLTAELTGAGDVLDVGNGGVFEYDPTVVESVTAVDLFFDDEGGSAKAPPNVVFRKGDALGLTEESGSFDVVVQAFLYHHLTGVRAADSIENTRRAISEAARVLKPSGRLVVAESCIPSSLYGLEKMLYQPLRALAATRLLGGHPATLQLPVGTLRGLVDEQMVVDRVVPIPLGRWITQFGRRWPTALTPARAFMIVARPRE
jgi:SAM-dependent methyltransferase